MGKEAFPGKSRVKEEFPGKSRGKDRPPGQDREEEEEEEEIGTEDVALVGSGSALPQELANPCGSVAP